MKRFICLCVAAFAINSCAYGPASSVISDPAERFVVLTEFGDDAVYDKETRLTWYRSFPADDRETDWKNAVLYCNSLSVNGLLGWRLPTIQELSSLFRTEEIGVAPPGREEWTDYKQQSRFQGMDFFRIGSVRPPRPSTSLERGDDVTLWSVSSSPVSSFADQAFTMKWRSVGYLDVGVPDNVVSRTSKSSSLPFACVRGGSGFDTSPPFQAPG